MNARKAIGWFLTGLLTLAFLGSAITKWIGIATPMFALGGYPTWFAKLIAVLEVLGGIGLIVSLTAFYATIGLSLLMLGAAYTHLANHEGLQVLRPLIFVVVLWLAWGLRFRPVHR